MRTGGEIRAPVGWPGGIRHQRRGFTLIEVMVSGVLMAIVLAAAYACLHAGLRTQQWIDPRLDALQGGRVVLALLVADLRAAAPLAPDNEWVGLRREVGGSRQDRLDIGTLNHTPRRTGQGDFGQVGYWVEPDPETGVPTLWRRRNPGLGPDPFSGGRREALVSGVRHFALEYHDGFEWFDNWGDPRERVKAAMSNRTMYNVTGMPRAVRIRLHLDPGRRPDREGAARPGESRAEPPLQFHTVVQVMVPRNWTSAAAPAPDPEGGS